MTGLSSISLSGSAKKKIPSEARVYSGSHCQWIDLNKVLSDGIGCANGYKFEIKPQDDNRSQLLFVEGKTILAFVKGNEKFANCSSFEEVTTQVDCKVIILFLLLLILLSNHLGRLWLTWKMSAFPLPALQVNITSFTIPSTQCCR